MFKPTSIYIFILIITFLFSCQKNSNDPSSLVILKRAQTYSESNPEKTLSTLDSISNPQMMDRGDYMQYIVTQVQAKYKTYQDITKDTLIFHAKRYFEQREDPRKTALAQFYAGSVCRENKVLGSALKCYLQSRQSAEKANDSLLEGKILHNIADLYFEQDVMDSAIVYYKQALHHFDTKDVDDRYRMDVLKFVGRTYKAIGNLDSAYVYYNKGLNIAKEVGNKIYQSAFTHYIGNMLRVKGDYVKSNDYLHKALVFQPTSKDSLLIYLNLSKLFNNTGDADSANYYINQIKNRLPDISDKYVLRSLYGSLSDYNKQIGNYEEALRFNDMQQAIDKEIKESNDSQKLFRADKRFYLEQKDKQLKSRQVPYIIYIVVVFGIAFAAYYLIKDYRNSHRLRIKSEHLQAKFEKQKAESEQLTQSIYKEMISKLTPEERESFVKESGKQPINTQIKELISYNSQKSNRKLLTWAYDLVRSHPMFSEQLMNQLKEREIVLLALSADEFSDNEISLLLEIPISRVKLLKTELKASLEKAGLPSTDIEKILFIE